MKSIDLWLLRKAQMVSDASLKHFGIDNFRLSRFFFSLVTFPLYAELVYVLPRLPKSMLEIGLLGVITFVLWLFIFASDRGIKVGTGVIDGILVPFSPGFIYFAFLRPWTLGLFAIATCSLIALTVQWRLSISMATDVPYEVWKALATFIEVLFFTVGLFFLSCEKKHFRSKDYEVYAS